MKNLSDLSLVIPAKEEPNSLPKVLEELNEYDCQKIIVIEKQDTKTYESIKNFNCKIIYQSNKGYGNAIREGINNVKTEYLSIFYADGSTDPKYLIKMLDIIKSNKISLVFGTRYEGGGKSLDDDFITRVGNFFFSLVGNILFGLNLSDILFTYIIGKKSSFERMKLFSNNYNLCVEIPIKSKLMGIPYASLPCIERKRIADKKKVKPFKVGLEILFFIIKCYLNSDFIYRK